MNSSVKYSDNDFYQVLGRITVAFATWDYYVTTLILNLPSKGMSINDRTTLKKLKKLKDRTTLYQKLKKLNDWITLNQKPQKLKGLHPDQVKSPKVLEKLKNILPEAIRLSEARNRYIHDHWVFNEDTISVGEIKKMRLTGLDKGIVKISTEKLSITALNNFLNEIILMHNNFGILLKYLEPVQ